MTNFSHGREAEQAAVQYLEKHGFKVRDRNWRTKYCEIDIITAKSKIVYFVEVKYRQHADQGTGLEYVTPKKLKQMRFAAEMWLNDDGWDGDYCLAVIEVSGTDYVVTEFITDIE